MKRIIFLLAPLGLTVLFPCICFAQTLNQDVQQLQGVLQNVYDQMIPLADELISVSEAIGSFAAVFYIGFRVWRHIANAEPIDFYPLLRPFVFALMISRFSLVLTVINGVLNPVVTVTNQMVKNSNDAVQNLLAEREAAIKRTDEWKVLVGPSGSGDREGWYKYTHPGPAGQQSEGFFASIGNDVRFAMDRLMYNIKNAIKYIISIILEMIYYAASLCIDTIRTFHLVVLAILGPIVFGLSIFDGFQQSLSQWLARYVNIFMWLPVANLFGAILGKIQENMLKLDLSQIQNSGTTTFTSTDLAYLIFLIIGIIGYTTVPGVANYIIHAHAPNPLLSKSNQGLSSATSAMYSNSNTQNNHTTNNSLASNSGNASGSSYHHNKISG